MDFPAIAKTNSMALKPLFASESSCFAYLRDAASYMLSQIGEGKEAFSLLDALLPEDGGKIMAPSVTSKDLFLLLERGLLCICDALLDILPIREFQKAVALETVRQKYLLPLLEDNVFLQKELGVYQKSPLLRRHTPRGW